MNGPRALCEPSAFTTDDDDEDGVYTIALHDSYGRSVFSNTSAADGGRDLARRNSGRGVLY